MGEVGGRPIAHWATCAQAIADIAVGVVPVRRESSERDGGDLCEVRQITQACTIHDPPNSMQPTHPIASPSGMDTSGAFAACLGLLKCKEKASI